MTTLKDWLNLKFVEWEKAQGGRQSYYAFARYLEVGQSGLAQWMTGSANPAGEDLISISNKLGPEVYEVMGLPRPNSEVQRVTVSFASLPADIRKRLASAIAEADQTMRQEHLRPETAEGRKIVLDSLAKWGFRYTG
jgi:hypothetical protein